MKHNALGTLALVAALLPVACADTGTGNHGTTPDEAMAGQHLRHRPRRAAIARAMDEAATRAASCLPPSVASVNVAGAFLGATGEYHVDGVTSEQPLSSELRECVREQFEEARVDPFTVERAEAGHGVTHDGAAPVAAVSPPSVGPVGGDNLSPTPVPGPIAEAPPPEPVPAPVPAPEPAHPTPAPHRPVSHAVASGPLAVSSFVGCYRTAVRTTPTLAGRARLQFTVNEAGTAQGIQVAQVGPVATRTPQMGQVLHCIVQRVHALNLSEQGPGPAEYSLTFVPAAGGSITLEPRNAIVSGLVRHTEPTPTTTAPAPDAAPPSGSVDMAQIANVVRGRTADVRTCYTNGLARDAQLRLQLRVRFQLEQAGTVASTSSRAVVLAGDPDVADDVARCVESIVHGTTFPARSSGGTQEAVLPFNFTPTPGVASGAPAAAPAGPVTGRIDPGRVSMAIRGRTPVLRECYTRALGTDPTLAGRVMVHFVVDPGGRVQDVNSQTTVRSGNPAHLTDVAHCIEGVMQGMTLPPPNGGAAAVALPFDFGPTSM